MMDYKQLINYLDENLDRVQKYEGLFPFYIYGDVYNLYVSIPDKAPEEGRNPDEFIRFKLGYKLDDGTTHSTVAWIVEFNNVDEDFLYQAVVGLSKTMYKGLYGTWPKDPDEE